MEKTLIVGVGSILRGDDGVGIRAIDELEKEGLPGEVTLHCGDISGLDLLKVFPGFKRIIIIDAADMKEAPGTIKVFKSSDIRDTGFDDKFSTHGMALLETLTLAKKLDLTCDIRVVGVQPEDTGYKLELSDLINGKLPEIIKTVKGLI